MILLVDDTYQFHEENLKQNRHHYSFFAKRLPLFITNKVQSTGSQIYFNPLIPMKTFQHEESLIKDDLRKLKYGVIQLDNAIADLTQWDSFALAGRT